MTLVKDPTRRNRSGFAPPWFKRSKYAGAHRLRATEWHLLLLARQYCGALFSGLFDEDSFDPVAEESRFSILNALRSDPLCVDDATRRILVDKIAPLNRNKSLAVRSVTVGDLYDQEREISEEARREARARQELKGAAILSKRPSPYLSEPVFRHSSDVAATGLLMVDLTLPDSLLKTQFAEWLGDSRRNKKADSNSRKHHGPSYSEWAAMGLLPCMDLFIWARERHTRLRNRHLAFLIFDDPSREDAIRKTTAPLAEEFLDYGSRGTSLLHRLQIEVFEEAVEADRAKARVERRKQLRNKTLSI